MTEEKVSLRVKGYVIQQDQQAEDMELIADGVFTEDDGLLRYTYQESEGSGMEGTETTVQVEGDEVSIIRLGAVTSILQFELGKRNVSMYGTPHGDIAMGLQTDNIQIKKNEKGKIEQIDVTYKIDLQGVPQSLNTISIEIEYPEDQN